MNPAPEHSPALFCARLPIPKPRGMAGLLMGALLWFGLVAGQAQDSAHVTGTTLTLTNMLRLLVGPPPAEPGRLVLESSDSLQGLWWKEPEFLRQDLPEGIEFLTPTKERYPQRFYRLGRLGRPALPYIKFICPNKDVQPGLSVTLLGADFAPRPADNTVRFEWSDLWWNAQVTEAATNYLLVTVPTNLTLIASTGTVYRVSVTTSQGTGNGVGCTVRQLAGKTFAMRPSLAHITQPPGHGKQTYVLGGGVPPYHLYPQTTNDLAIAVARLDGPLVEVTGMPGKNGYIRVDVLDSSPSEQWAHADVYVLPADFTPEFTATFHTLQAGTAPSWTASISQDIYELWLEKAELQFLNVQVNLSALDPGQVVGLVRIYDFYHPEVVFDYQHLVVTELLPGRARLDLVSYAGGAVTTIAKGEFIQSPPTIVLGVPNPSAPSLVPEFYTQEIIFNDGIFRLPPAEQKFSVVGHFASLSARGDVYLPQRRSLTNTFTTTGISAGAPRIESLRPTQGEVGLNVSLRGAGFSPNSADNLVTFAGNDNTRVPAVIREQTNEELIVTVPTEAVTGPVQLTVAGKTSNPYQFAVRFHPETALLPESLIHDTPTTFRLLHQQPLDVTEDGGEWPFQSIVCTLDAGGLALTNLSTNQVVGALLLSPFDDPGVSTNDIVYVGKETAPAGRHVFEVPLSRYWVLARLYLSENAGGQGITFQVENGGASLLPFRAGALYDFRLNTPVYRPGPAAGTDVSVRVETISRPYQSLPETQMRHSVNAVWRVE